MKKSLFVFLIFFLFRPLLAWPELTIPKIPTTRMVLPNGLRLIVRERPDTESVTVMCMIRAGQITEDEEKAGTTNLLQNYLTEIPAEEHTSASAAIEEVGGVLSASTYADFSVIRSQVPANALPLAMSVLSRLLHTDHVDSKLFEQVKKEDLRMITQSQNDTFQVLYSIFLQQFYQFHPYKVPVYGLLSTVKKITSRDLLSYEKQYYVPGNLVLSVVGNVATDQAVALAEKYFSDLPQAPIPSQTVYYQPVLDDDKTLDLEETGNIAWIFLGFSAPELASPHYATMNLLNSVLGASIGSRIWLSIREKRGLSYELGSQYEAREGPGHFLIYVTTSPENLEESKRSLLGQIDRIRKEPLTSEELATLKRSVIGHFILETETNPGQARFLAWSELFGKGIMYDEGYLDEIQRVDSNEVLNVANQYLSHSILISVK